MGFSLPSRLSQNLRPWPLDRGHLSWGSLPLQRTGRRESTSVRFPGSASLALPGWSASGSHPAGYGVARRFSQPLSDFCLSPPLCHFQADGTPGVRPFRGLFLPRSPGDSSPPACPPDVSPIGSAEPPFLGGDFPWARWTLPRMSRPAPFRRLQGFRLRGNRSASSRRFKASMTDLPLLGFLLLMVLNPRVVGPGSPARPSPLHEQWVRRQIHHPLRLTACHSRERTLCHQRALPSQGSSPPPPSPAWVTSQHGLIGHAPLRLEASCPLRDRATRFVLF
jgi:hypothetical protein